MMAMQHDWVVELCTVCTHCCCLSRRAQLRDCLEVLRQHVPLPDKLTTLALLQSARKYIEVSQFSVETRVFLPVVYAKARPM